MEKYTLITGASSGIGKDFADVFAKNGNNLILIARRKELLKEIKENLLNIYPNVDIKILSKDLSKPGSAKYIYDLCRKNNYIVDNLVNNAGFGDYGLFSKSLWHKNEGMIYLNCITLVQLSRLFLPTMFKYGGGNILNVGSTAAFLPGPYMTTYYSTKHFVKAFSLGLREEVKVKNVNVTLLCPGVTDTGFQKRARLYGVNFLKTKSLIQDSMSVAEFGYKAMVKKKAIAIPGIINKFFVFLSRLLPNTVLAKIAKKMQSKKKRKVPINK